MSSLLIYVYTYRKLRILHLLCLYQVCILVRNKKFSSIKSNPRAMVSRDQTSLEIEFTFSDIIIKMWTHKFFPLLRFLHNRLYCFQLLIFVISAFSPCLIIAAIMAIRFVLALVFKCVPALYTFC